MGSPQGEAILAERAVVSAGHKQLKVEAIADSKPKIKFVLPNLRESPPISFEEIDSNTLAGDMDSKR
jgi:hypothetical protein